MLHNYEIFWEILLSAGREGVHNQPFSYIRGPKRAPVLRCVTGRTTGPSAQAHQ
jgi:hypothetical protein